MIDRGTALNLQALLDGELTAAEAAAATRLLDQNPEARRLFDELELTRSVLVRCEPLHAVPATREFYWSGIQRAIDRGESVGVGHAGGWWMGWMRWAVPAGAAVVLGLFLLQRAWVGPDQEPPVLLATDHEVETLLADTTSISFRSESAGMTVVWMQSSQPNYFGSGY